MYIREDMADIRVSLNGVPYGDSWKETEGGNLESDDAKARPGAMGREVSAGGPASRGDLTVRTNLTDITATWLPAFENECGNGDVLVTVSWLGRGRSPLGTGFSRKGTLKSVNTPDMGGGSDVGMFEIVVSCDELAA
jgi:hypothetical protein